MDLGRNMEFWLEYLQLFYNQPFYMSFEKQNADKTVFEFKRIVN